MCINKDIIRTAFFIDRYLYRIKKVNLFGGLRGISLSSYISVSAYFSGHESIGNFLSQIMFQSLLSVDYLFKY